MDFYYLPASAPCRSVMLTAKAVGVDLNKKYLSLEKGDHLKPEFIAINPQHCIPTLVDGDFTLWESRVICTYLAAKHGPDSLYPKDARTRAQVDKLLYFDMGTLYQRFGLYAYPFLFGQVDKPDEEKLEKVHEALGWLNGFLDGHDYAVGDEITVADHSLVASVSSFEECGLDIARHKNVAAWLERCKKNLTGYESENVPGAKEFGQWFKKKLAAL